MAATLLLLLFALLTLGAARLAPTADETAHMAGGYSLVVRPAAALDLLSQRGYPPLMPALQGLLIAAGGPQVPVTALSGWPEAFDIFAESFAAALPDYGAALFASRLPAIWLTVLMAAIVHRWAGLAFGRPAGWFALALFLMDPTLLAHGRLATTDAGVTCLGLASLYAAWRWTRVGGWRWSLGCGLLLGGTMLAKVSGPIWAVAVGLVMVVGGFGRYRQRIARLWPQIAAVPLLAFAVLWAAYGFRMGPLADTGLIVPAPSHWESIFYLTGYHSLFFALGERQRVSWWWYFPVAFLIKNPLVLLFSWMTGVVALLPLPLARRRATRGRGTSRLALATVLLFPLIYAATATVEGMNIGYRHMLPIHPLLHIAAGLGLATLWRWRSYLVRGLLVIVLLVGAVQTWRLFPDELAFFNVLIGGPLAGYRYLVDSNLDWGQNENALSSYLMDHPEASAAPPATPFQPAPGHYVVGASELQGVGVADPYAYEWFRHRQPVAQPAPGLLVYAGTSRPALWIAQCGTPEVPLTPEQLASGLGETQRRITFDCTEAWLLPDGGATPGIYALPGALLAPRARRLPGLLLQPPTAEDPGLRRWLGPMRLSFYNRRAAVPFALYELDPQAMASGSGEGEAPGPALAGPVYLRRADAIPAETAGNQIATCVDLKPGDARCPCPTGGPLTFLGVSVVRGESAIEVESWWRVDDGPINRNFSLMGHLITSSGEIVGTDDGAGILPTTLLAGDLFAQRHTFVNPGDRDTPGLWFRTGGYWLDTKARWSTGDDGADVFLVPID